MNSPYSAAAIANWFLDKAEAEGKPITPMKLQKLIYFANGWYLALTGKPLLDEHVQAWDYGPVIPSLYHEFKDFGRGAIKDRATKFVASKNTDSLLDGNLITPRIQNEPEVEKFLDKIWEVYGNFSAVQLANLSHGEAWKKTYEGAQGRKGVYIPDECIKEEFSAKRANAA